MRKKLVGLALLGLLVGCSRTDRPPVAVGETATEEAAAATTQETTEIETEEMTAAETTTEWVAHEPILVDSPFIYWSEANEKANEKQKESLTYFKEHVKEINEDYLYIPLAYDYFSCARQIKIIMGDIPENHPRITVGQVCEICSEYTKDTVTEENLDEKSLEIEERINAIAGAPDYAGGNDPRRIYRLEDNDTQFIVLWGDRGVGQISLYDRDPESGKIYEVEEMGIVPDNVTSGDEFRQFYLSEKDKGGVLTLHKDSVHIYFPKTKQDWFLYEYMEPETTVYAKGITAEDILESVEQALQGNK